MINVKHNNKIKYNNCKYCGRLVLSRPYCSACSKKYFNFDPNFKYKYFAKNPQKLKLLKNSFPDYRETPSQRANRVFEKIRSDANERFSRIYDKRFKH